MTEYPAKLNSNKRPIHPGAVVEDILTDLPLSKTEVARVLGISRQHLYDILGEKKPVSPLIAAKIGKLFGNGPGLWLRMQATHDAWHAAREVDVSKIKTIKVRSGELVAAE